VPRANAGFNRPEFARPSVTQRPQFNRSNVIVPQRPTARIRPTIPPRLPTERPRVTKRPQFNRPNVANRPNINTFNRNFNTSNRNFNTFNRNRWDYSRDHGSYQRPWWNRPAYWNRSWYAGRPVWYWGRPYYWQHARWYHGFWNYWPTLPSLWFGTGLAAGWLLSPGDAFVYSNPYYVPYSPTGVVTQYLDYSNPLPAPPTDQLEYAYPPAPDQAEDGSAAFSSAAPPVPPADDETVRDAKNLLDQARAVFREDDYVQAQTLVERAIALLPSDPALHEFRALTLFAQQKYRDAAATLYAVLAAGPGWDWPTMASFYRDVETYTRQLRALEEFVGRRPEEPAGRFVLAYHYLVLGHKDQAAAQLRAVLQLQPQDKLSAALLQALTSANAAGGVAAPPLPNR
jgi:tetratricopeptide (TPR) repeat protein